MLLKIIQPYTRVRIPFIAQKLNIPAPDVEQLLVSLILDGRVAGNIDQVRRSGGGGELGREGLRGLVGPRGRLQAAAVCRTGRCGIPICT